MGDVVWARGPLNWALTNPVEAAEMLGPDVCRGHPLWCAEVWPRLPGVWVGSCPLPTSLGLPLLCCGLCLGTLSSARWCPQLWDAGLPRGTTTTLLRVKGPGAEDPGRDELSGKGLAILTEVGHSGPRKTSGVSALPETPLASGQLLKGTLEVATRGTALLHTTALRGPRAGNRQVRQN